MTDIEQKARDIAELAQNQGCVGYKRTEEAARLGIIEGLEMAANVAEQWDENSPYSSRAAAIRALIEENSDGQ